MHTRAARRAALRRLERDTLTAEILAGNASDYALDEAAALRSIVADARCAAATRAAARSMLAGRAAHHPTRPTSGTPTPRPGRRSSTSWADLPEARRRPDPLRDVGRPRQPTMPVTEAQRAAARRALRVHRLPWEGPDPSEP